MEDIKLGAGLESYTCDCCDFNKCCHSSEGSQLIGYLYRHEKCIHPMAPSPDSFDLCQACYEAGVRCLVEGHKMELKLNCISYCVFPNEEDLKCYIHWRMMSDSSLRTLMTKIDGIQTQVFDAVLRSSGSMHVGTFHGRLERL